MKHKYILIVILILGLVLRWYKIDNPIADWHSWRQADTASVSREFVKQGTNPLVPKFQDLSALPSTFDNPQGYRMTEFPFYSLIHSQVSDNLRFWSLEKWGRALSVFYSLITITFLYLIVSHLSGKKTALLAAFFQAVLPFSVYYSRTILPDPLMLALLLIGTYYFLQSLEKPKTLNFSLSIIFLALSLLVRPYAIFFFLPLFWFAFKRYRATLFTDIKTYLFLALIFAPFIIWRFWIQQYPQGIPTSGWLFNLHHARLRPAWWRWLFFERIGKLILGVWAVIPFFLGIIIKPNKKENWFYHLWAFGVIAYFIIFSGGNITHDYYQFIATPTISVLLAKGVHYLLSPHQSFSRPLTLFGTTLVIALSLFFSWYQVRGYYQVNNWSIVEAGQAVDQLIPQDAKVIAPYQGDTAFLYQTNRTGWPIIQTDIPDLIEKGATHYVSVNYDDQTNALLNDPDYTVIEKNDKFVLIRLQ